ncbi:MAG: DUF3641 domain-containing protein [Verrucomicrobiales bacterium]|nr:DUF3641 domain-containing protein [Verrucomicrobiales bacterium]
MNRFDSLIAGHGLSLRRRRIETLQINVGRKGNQTCTHCHVDAAPWRREMMAGDVARRVGAWIREHRPPLVDLGDVTPESLEGQPVRTGDHCLACTAGGGSSCTGAVTAAADQTEPGGGTDRGALNGAGGARPAPSLNLGQAASALARVLALPARSPSTPVSIIR